MACAVNHTVFETVLLLPKDQFESLCQVAIIMLLFLKLLTQRAKPQQWLILSGVIVLGFLSWRQAGEGWLFWLILFVACSEGAKIRPLAVIVFSISLTTLSLTVLSALLGIIPNNVFTRQGEMRYAMGFTHPNFFGMYLMMICVSFSCMRFGKNPALDIILILCLTLINVAVSNSRSSVVLSAVLIFLLVLFYFSNTQRRKELAIKILLLLVISTLLGSIYFMIFYDPENQTHALINSILSGRLYLAHSYYQMAPLSLFGNSFESYAPIYWESGRWYSFVVDNAYCHLILRYGIIPSFVFFVGYALLLRQLLRNKRFDVILFGISLMAVYGFTETLGVRVECNFFLIALGTEVLYAKSSNVVANGGKL